MNDISQQVESGPNIPACCPNCTEPLTGPFCANCGQQDREIKQPLRALISSALGSLFDLDSRSIRTIFLLFTRPAFLSLSYLEGRRASNTNPFRLFLAISIVFFLLLSIGTRISSLDSTLNGVDEQQGGPTLSFQIDDAPIDTETGEQLDSNGDPDPLGANEWIDSLSLDPLSAERAEIVRERLKSQIAENVNAINADPTGFLSDSLEYSSVVVLLLMPLLALIQKLIFFSSRKLYIEHLIFTLHNHAFLFLCLTFGLLTDSLSESTQPVLAAVFGLADGLLNLWMFIYLFMSLRNFFNQGYFVTFLKFTVATTIYGMCFLAAMLLVVLIAFIAM
ncbi:MAG: hypothetical protein DHS20C12_29250 [Pseudohongiella sp.]|nr:MAG: hypothetical protein DHS20C12_29250 [Pseudohongiella sp.]